MKGEGRGAATDLARKKRPAERVVARKSHDSREGRRKFKAEGSDGTREEQGPKVQR